MSKQEGKDEKQFNTIFILFVTMRLTFTLFFSVEGLLTDYTDNVQYYKTALQSENGYYPFVNMWYEYQPVLSYIPQIAYELVRMSLPPGGFDSFSFLLFSRILQIILIPFDAGILILTYDIAQKLWGYPQANRIGWIYTSLSLPLFFWTFSHHLVLVFFVMLSISLFLENKKMLSSIFLGLAIVTKLTPIFLIAPIIKFLWRQTKQILLYIVVSGVVTFLAYLPFVALGGTKWIIASFVAISHKSSYRTLWAMLDGNWGYGYLGDVESWRDISQASVSLGNPSLISPLILLVPFAFIYGVIFLKKIPNTPYHFIYFTTLTATLFHLWLSGWSPQWSTLFVPLILLSFPSTQGLSMVLILTLSVFLEWPFGTILNSKWILSLSILIRTGLFIILALMTADKLGMLGWMKRRGHFQPENS